MNYRHAFHAGNFADVLKHMVLALLIEHLKQKDGAFRVIDIHAGGALYDLSGDEAGRTGEWRQGIGRLIGPEAAPLDPALRAAAAPYLDIVEALNPDGLLRHYPGSPLLARRLLRRQDRLTACELHEAEAARLAEAFAGDIQVRTIRLDGWLALKAFVPPKERRGLVLVDPPFEKPGEFDRMAEGFAEAWRRWPGGTYLFWYPIKDRVAADGFLARFAAIAGEKSLRMELETAPIAAGGPMQACGLAVANPPWTLGERLAEAGPALAACLAPGRGTFRLDVPAGNGGRLR